ncbi:hypothetical protein [Amycolatopsis benzoatilytica]|uniref:hypothetical protein n=1 Tax=Amycolatopsis benzoatilytica TaxID=346045 RepID=UPI00036AEE9D|nr:hypothetical protein [Amycolatopsis benzoatilytica]
MSESFVQASFGSFDELPAECVRRAGDRLAEAVRAAQVLVQNGGVDEGDRSLLLAIWFSAISTTIG